ncbi:hypothetical protein BLD48_05955 [Exiguobacterium sp. KRL4]|nr:hypothetical protein BLD48_05955 [Exiguobacterium sp. KRL4]
MGAVICAYFLINKLRSPIDTEKPVKLQGNVIGIVLWRLVVIKNAINAWSHYPWLSITVYKQYATSAQKRAEGLRSTSTVLISVNAQLVWVIKSDTSFTVDPVGSTQVIAVIAKRIDCLRGSQRTPNVIGIWLETVPVAVVRESAICTISRSLAKNTKYCEHNALRYLVNKLRRATKGWRGWAE